MPRSRPAEIRFWEKVNKTDDCWLWTAGVDGKGYGHFSLNGRHTKVRQHINVHRGDIPKSSRHFRSSAMQ